MVVLTRESTLGWSPETLQPYASHAYDVEQLQSVRLTDWICYGESSGRREFCSTKIAFCSNGAQL